MYVGLYACTTVIIIAIVHNYLVNLTMLYYLW